MGKFDYLDIFKEILNSIEDCGISFEIKINEGIYTLNIFNNCGGVILPIEDRIFKGEFNTFSETTPFVKYLKIEIKNDSIYYTCWARWAAFTNIDCNTSKYGWKKNSLNISDFEKQMLNDMYIGNFYQIIEGYTEKENNV